jgi:hypothetical protein
MLPINVNAPISLPKSGLNMVNYNSGSAIGIGGNYRPLAAFSLRKSRLARFW